MLSFAADTYLRIVNSVISLSAVSLPVVATQCQTSNITQAPGTIQNQTICIGDTEQRSYMLFLPANYETTPNARPLILSYHGGNRDPTDQIGLDLFTTPYFNSDSIVVYPQGKDETWQGVPEVSTDDKLFTSSLLDLLSSRYRVDTSAIYATGKSQGGGFVGVLACDANFSRRIAAFAPVSGAFYTTVPGDQCHPKTVKIDCQPSRPLPFIEFHGGVDGTINYNGGERRKFCLPSIPHYLTEWARRNHLNVKNQTSELTQDTVVYTFGNGLVKGYYDRSIGHDWPSTIANSDSENNGDEPATFNASTIIMDFFKQYRLPS